MPFEEYPAFLGSELGFQHPATSLFHVVPVPYEKTTSYGHGTKKGPSALLKASWQLELFDGKGIPANRGIYTHREIDCEGDGQEVLSLLQAKISEIFTLKKIPIMIGGEHTITLAAARALMDFHPGAGIVQFDAHADLRDSYEGDPLSHACVMRRISELGIPLFQVGIRSLCLEENEYRISKGIKGLDAKELIESSQPRAWLPEGFPEKVYVTIDIDAFDSSFMPATGTPEPGGLSWPTMLSLLSYISSRRDIVGFDLVELAPIKGMHAYDYASAKLVYLFMGMISEGVRGLVATK